MRWLYGCLLAGGLMLAGVQTARAQDSTFSFGGIPAGITTGSPYGFYPGGYVQTYSRYPTASGYAVAPSTSYYTSGYYGGTPGTTIYGPGVDLSSPNAAAYGYSAPLYPTTRYAPYYGYGTYTTRPGYVRRGLLGRSRYYP